MKLLGFLLALLLVCIGGWVAFELVREILRLYGRSDADVKIAVITASGSALAFLINNSIQSARERRARLFENKREAYDKFFGFLFGVLDAQKNGKSLTEEDLAESFQDFTRSVMTWGSAETVNAVIAYQNASIAVDPDDFSGLFQQTETLLRALRKDLGHSDRSLKPLGLTLLLVKAEDHHKIR